MVTDYCHRADDTIERMTHIILVPGFWLGAWAWDDVSADLRERGHSVTPLTLPGLDPSDDRSRTSLLDQAKAIVAQADRSVLVAHSGGGAAAYLATDLAPASFQRVVYCDSGPLPDGFVGHPDLDDATTEVPLPTWAELEAMGNSLEGLDAAALEQFRTRSIPEPANVMRTPLELRNPERLLVPTTILCHSFPAAAVRQMRDAGIPMGIELRQIDADYIDLPTGHWPMWSKPAELAATIHSIANREPAKFAPAAGGHS